MVRSGIQLHTLRDLPGDPGDIVERVGATSFQGIECYDAHFDMLSERSTLEEMRSALATTGLEVVGAHVRIERLETDLDHVLEICGALECSSVVIPTYDRDAFRSVEAIEAAADRIANLATTLSEHDLALLYHNHTFEFDEVGGSTAYKRFVERANGRFGFEPDVGLARHAGYEERELLGLVAGQAPLVHLTLTVPDDPERLHADPDEPGVIDLEAWAEQAIENGAKWLICENGVTEDAEATLARGSEAFDRL